MTKLKSVSTASVLPGLLFVLIFLLEPGTRVQSSSPRATVGPANGWLVLAGGGIDRENEAGHKFAALAGGINARVVVVVTPIDLDVLTPDFFTKYRQVWETEYGVPNVTFMDARDRLVADTEEFVAPLRKATGVWICGGHLTNLLNAYLNTKIVREIEAIAERGGVVGGTSAGAMIQGSFLINVTKSPGGMRISRTGMFLDPTRLVGFGILKDTTVYPHLSARKAQKDVAEVIAHYHELLGIGIDERTAIIVHNDQFEVMGAGHVEVFDAQTPFGRKGISLFPGQRFDLKKRTVIS